MAAVASSRSLVLLLLLLALYCSHAKKGRPVRRPAKSSGGGFGRAARTPASKPGGFGSAARAPVVPPNPRSSLETKLLQEHTTNCAIAKQIFAVCDDDSGACTYTAGWEPFCAPTDAVAPGNAPYATDALLRRSRGALLSEHECASLVDAMEAHGATQGWDQRYPLAGYTREVKVSDMPEAHALLNSALRSTLLPAAAAAFGFAPSTLRVNEALVVKYDAASGHNALPVHVDFSLLTLNVALSPPAAYDGGGTWFQHDGQILTCGRGEGLLHAGGLTHCGVPVTEGSRYVLVLFLLATTQPLLAARLHAIGAAAGVKPQFTFGAPRTPVDLELSCALLERAIKANPRDGESWSQLGHNHMHARRLHDAARCFTRVVGLSDGRDFAALCDCAVAQAALRDHAASLASSRAALQLGPPPGPSAKARVRVRARARARARGRARGTARASTSNNERRAVAPTPALTPTLSLTLTRTRTVTLTLTPTKAEARTARMLEGDALRGLARYEEASLAFFAVTEEDPSAVEAWAALGACMDALGQAEAADNCRSEVLRIKMGA